MIVIRTARRTDATGIARVHEATWKEAYNGLLDEAYLAALTERRLTPRWRRSLDHRAEDLDDQIYVAVAGKEVVGFVMVGASRETFAPWDAEISMVYVLKEHRGVGVGRTLMKTAADHCIRRAMFSGGLWVLRDNGPARDFYEALQGEHAGRKADGVGGRVVPLVGYFWRDMATLAERATPRVEIGGI
ncbi:MAG: GNAT family N-acetyltransferase [Alphaproteobacteria bacterium]|nr:GNAT family N-acetyltransferase [Alphaproteobacteria bacterium]